MMIGTSKKENANRRGIHFKRVMSVLVTVCVGHTLWTNNAAGQLLYKRIFLVATATSSGALARNISGNSRVGIAASSLVSRDDIESADYIVLDYACLQVKEPLPSIITAARILRNVSKTARNHNKTDQQLKDEEEPSMIEVQALVKSKFHSHKFYVEYRNEESERNTTAGVVFEKGAYLVASHHTPDNNFHVHNDFLLPVFRAYQRVNIKGLLLLRGTESRWETRLPIVNSVLSAMNLNVTYPMEEISEERCFERLVVERIVHRPYYSHQGRFSSFWPQRIFDDYRDKVHAYFQASSVSIDNNSTSESNSDRAIDEAIDAAATVAVQNIHDEPNATAKPILSWVSRGCGGKIRCVMNESDVVLELSKYFWVNFMDFTNKSFTIDRVMDAVMETDVFVGLHGAGLGSTCLLPKNAMLVELRGDYGHKKKLFMNMASMLNLPYYAVDIKQWDQMREMYTIPALDMTRLAIQIYEAWKFEHEETSQAGERSNSNFTGECVFPSFVSPAGHLSNTTVSRCYLERNPNLEHNWSQCVVFGC